MRKVVVFLAIMMVVGSCYAADFKANAYQMTTYVNSSQTYVNVTFPLPSRDVIITNSDASQNVRVDINSITRTSLDALGTAGTITVPPLGVVSLRNYAVAGITFLYDTYSGEASPVSVMSLY